MKLRLVNRITRPAQLLCHAHGFLSQLLAGAASFLRHRLKL
jgi:hypothetical protein